MSIISNFFGSKTQTKNQPILTPEPQNTVVETIRENIPPIDLFLDPESPQPDQQVAEETENRITVFLNRNYHSMGTSDGFEYHSQETMDVGKKKIRAEFQLILDQAIQEKFGSRLQMKNLIVDVTKVSDDARQKLENTVEELNSSLVLLQKQKELSAENEGWVMNAVHSYHQGFVQGLNDYITSEHLLNSIKNV